MCRRQPPPDDADGRRPFFKYLHERDRRTRFCRLRAYLLARSGEYLVLTCRNIAAHRLTRPDIENVGRALQAALNVTTRARGGAFSRACSPDAFLSCQKVSVSSLLTHAYLPTQECVQDPRKPAVPSKRLAATRRADRAVRSHELARRTRFYRVKR